jgi:hypothetical protein
MAAASRRVVSLESGQITRVAAQFRRDPMVRVPADREGKDHHPGGEVSDVFHHSLPGLLRVLQMGIRKSRIPPLNHSEYLRRPFCFLRPESGAPSGAGFACSEVEDTDPISGITRLEERAGARQFDVIAVGGNRQDVDRHGGI